MYRKRGEVEIENVKIKEYKRRYILLFVKYWVCIRYSGRFWGEVVDVVLILFVSIFVVGWEREDVYFILILLRFFLL